MDFRGWGQLSTRTTVEPAGQTGQAAGSTAQKWVKGQTEHIAVYGCLETPEVNGRGGGGFAGSHCVHVMRWGRGSRQSYQLQAGFSSGSGGVAVCLCRRECAITKKIWLSRSSMSCAQSRVIFENSCAKRPLQRVNFFCINNTRHRSSDLYEVCGPRLRRGRHGWTKRDCSVVMWPAHGASPTADRPPRSHRAASSGWGAESQWGGKAGLRSE